MPHQASTDRELGRAGDKQRRTGWRILLIAAVLYAAGLVFILLEGDTTNFIGLALAALATPFALAGAGLVVSGLVSRRASQQKPFA